jgi:hypothetical protein
MSIAVTSISWLSVIPFKNGIDEGLKRGQRLRSEPGVLFFFLSSVVFATVFITRTGNGKPTKRLFHLSTGFPEKFRI